MEGSLFIKKTKIRHLVQQKKEYFVTIFETLHASLLTRAIFFIEMDNPTISMLVGDYMIDYH